MSHKIAAAIAGSGALIGAYLMTKNRSNNAGVSQLALDVPLAEALVNKDRPPLFKFDVFGTCRGKVLGRSKVDTSYRGAPFSEMDCGEDAFFVTQNLLAVADGVGGWRDKGVDPAHFANALMQFTIQRAVHPRKEGPPATPKQLLVEGYSELLRSKTVEMGSSTAALAGLVTNKEGQPRLITANLGDSGIVVVRDGAVVFRARQLQHSFNFPYQLRVPTSKRADQPTDAAAEVFPLNTGDLVVVGSDGLFDNVFDEEVAAVAHTGNPKVDAAIFAEKLTTAMAKAGGHKDPRNAINAIATSRSTAPEVAAAIGPGCRVDESAKAVLAKARDAASSKTAIVPFGIEAAKAERTRTYAGGKMDDITVIVARVVPVATDAK